MSLDLPLFWSVSLTALFAVDRSRGVFPSAFLQQQSAPKSSRRSTMLAPSPRTAACKGLSWPQPSWMSAPAHAHTNRKTVTHLAQVYTSEQAKTCDLKGTMNTRNNETMYNSSVTTAGSPESLFSSDKTSSRECEDKKINKWPVSQISNNHVLYQVLCTVLLPLSDNLTLFFSFNLPLESFCSANVIYVQRRKLKNILGNLTKISQKIRV